MTVTALYVAQGLQIGMLVRERPGERILPGSAGEPFPGAQSLQLGGWAAIGRGLRRVVLLPAGLTVAIAGFVLVINDRFFDAFGPVFTIQSLGWTDLAFSNTMAVARLAGGVVGMVSGGLLVKWLGRTRAVRIALLATAAISVATGIAAPFWSYPLIAHAHLMLFTTAHTLATIAFFATRMALCWKPVAAVQFALFMAISNLGLLAGSAVMDPLVWVLTDAQVLFATAGAPILAALILMHVNVDAHVAHVSVFDAETAPTLDVPVLIA
jgi:MFS transporter, PAT family, beta-lactamase induction signal transducer AmpG